MQTPIHPTTNARPAASLAVPGTRRSCAVEPRAPLFGLFAGSGKDGWNAPRTGKIHQISEIEQDERDRKDQRGRAVACA